MVDSPPWLALGSLHSQRSFSAKPQLEEEDQLAKVPRPG